MGDRTVTFSAPMVLALLQGRKTQTRRLATSPLRLAAIGDRLVVREHWKTMRMHDTLSPTKLGEKYAASVYPERERAAPVLYLADEARRGRWAEDESDGWCPGKHRQGMHMPRWASRMSLVITGSRISRLQALTKDDAIAEGLYWHPTLKAWQAVQQDGWPTFTDPCRSYAGLWQHLHPAEGQRWDDNPKVLVLTFEVEHTPVHQ